MIKIIITQYNFNIINVDKWAIVDTIDKEGNNILFLTPNHINGIVFCSQNIIDSITIDNCPPENINNVKTVSSLFRRLKPGGEIKISFQAIDKNSIISILGIKKKLETFDFKYINISINNIQKENETTVKVIKIIGKKPKLPFIYIKFPEINSDKNNKIVLLNKLNN